MNDQDKAKLKILFEQNKRVHLNLHNGKFYNGILTYLGADFLLMDEFREGKAWLVFNADIKDDGVEVYENKKEKFE